MIESADCGCALLFFSILRCQWSLQGFSKSGSQHGSAQRFHFFFVTSFPVQVSLLVYDAILIEIWREEILPHLLKTESSLSPLMIYSVVSCQNMNNNQPASQPARVAHKNKRPPSFLFFSQPNDNTEINLRKEREKPFLFVSNKPTFPFYLIVGSCTTKEPSLACWSYCCTIRRPAKPWATQSSIYSTIAIARSCVQQLRRRRGTTRPWPTAQSSSTWTSATWRPTSPSAASPFYAFSPVTQTSNIIRNFK